MHPTPVSPALIRVAERFTAKLPARLETIEAAAQALSIDTADSVLADVERILHDIAGTGPLLGYAPLGEAARDAEAVATELRGSSIARTPEALGGLKAMLLELRHAAETQGTDA